MSLFHTTANDEAPVGDDTDKPADATPAADGEDKTEEPTAPPANG